MRPSRRPAAAIVTAFVVLLSTLAPAAAAEPKGPARMGDDALARDSWIVTLADGADRADAGGWARAAGGRAGHVYRHVMNGFQFHGSARAAAALARNPNVASVAPDGAIYLTETLPYGIERIAAYGLGGTTGAYQAGFTGAGARIAILDTGIDLDHPDLVASIDQGLGKHCVNPAFQPNDGIGHGTHVAGTAAAPINGVGVAGVAPEARLVAVKMFNDQAQSSEAIAICALDHIVGLNLDADPSNDVDVANMSWGEERAGGTCQSDALHGAICRAHAAGIILVAGSGNSAKNGNTFVPASYPEVIGVSAITDFDGKRGGLAGCGFVAELLANECDDTFAFFSNWGDVDIAAPGVRVHSTWVGGGWRTSSGTSMSTPHVAGVAALMAAAAPGLSPADARAAMLASGECPNGTAADSDAVAGCAGQGSWPDDPDATPEPLVHALRAAEAVAGDQPDPVPPSAPTLTATGTPTSIDLSWTAPATSGGAPVTGYEIYRGSSSGALTAYASVGAVLAYSDVAVATGEEWFYAVAAVNSAGEGDPSNEASAVVPEPPPPPDPPSAPTLTATPGNASVRLNWAAPADDGGGAITNYEIYRGTSAGTATLIATVGNVLTYLDTGRANGTAYWYQVAAKNAGGVGERSNEVSVTPVAPVTRPAAPTNLKATKTFGGVLLTWSAPTNTGGSPLTGFKLYRTGGAGTVVVTLPASQTSYLDGTGLRRTWYAYVVSASNAAGESQASNIVTIKTQ